MNLVKKLEYAKTHADFMLQDQVASQTELEAAVAELKALIEQKLAENIAQKAMT